MVSGIELQRRGLSMMAGVVFGVGWLVFIDGIIHFNGCLKAVDTTDPCNWGPAPLNMTDIDVVTPDDDHPGSGGLIPDEWDPTKPGFDPLAPFRDHTTTPPPPPKHRGWHTLSGRYTLVYLPGFLALISIFFINTIDARHLTTESDWITGGVDHALQVWLFFGFVAGFSAITVAVWVHIDLFDKHDDINSGPGVAGIIQVLMLLISSLLFWVARSLGVDSDLADPLL